MIADVHRNQPHEKGSVGRLRTWSILSYRKILIAGGVTLIALASVVKSQHPAPPYVSYNGICDASAALLAGDRVLVLNDEDQESTFVRLYDLRRVGAPAQSLRLDASPLALDRDEPEIDLEACTILGRKLLLTGSHSRSRKGKPRASRQRLFAVEWPLRPDKGSLRIEGRPYTSLLNDLQSAWRSNQQPGLSVLTLDQDLPPEKGGVSIEGLASTPAGELLIGFRSPLVDGKKAIVAHLLNPSAVLEGGPARFGPTSLIDLNGDGVRDLISDGDGYLVLSGAVGRGNTFGVHRWAGPAQPVTLLKRMALSELGIKREGYPEGIIRDPASGDLLLFLDEGDSCKVDNRTQFHMVRLSSIFLGISQTGR